ncbi:MAG: thioredoxin domain-containing protein [Bacteroidota bacterium]|nr:thioredoxin domain-containing protein [Bacteroidota bacterium]
MKKKIVFLSFAFLNLLLIVSCSNNKTTETVSEKAGVVISKSIGIDEFEKLLSAEAVQLIDVRTPEEFEPAHIKNATNININDDGFETQVSSLNKNAPVLVYCLSGGRSAGAAQKLEEMGFTKIYNMEGGIMAWDAANKTLEKSGTETTTGMTKADLDKLVQSKAMVLVDYNAKWCVPCKKMAPMLDKFVDARKEKLTLLKIDADENKELLKEKGISGIPVLELYKNGKLVWAHNGSIEENELVKETGI